MTTPLSLEPLHDCVRSWSGEQERLANELDESFAAIEAFQRQLESWQKQLAEERAALEQEKRDWSSEKATGEELVGSVSSLKQELADTNTRSQKLAQMLEAERQELAEQQKRWDDDFRRMRELLDEQAGGGEMVAEAPEAATPEPLAEDPVIDSVLAQFGKLREQQAGRRAASA